MKKSFKKDKTELLAEVSFDKDDIQKASNKAAVRVAQDITVPGFRKGKAPIDKAMAHISVEKFNDAVVNQLLREIDKNFATDEEFKKYVDGHKFANFHPDVHLEKFTETEADFHVHYILNPEISKLAKYTGIKPSIEKEKVDDKKVDEFIKDLAKQNAELIYKEDEIKKGDTCNIDFTGYIKGKEFDGGSAKSYDLEIGSKQFVPGFEDQLIGHKSGDKIDVKVTLPDNYPEPLNGKEALFKVTINDVKEKSIPKINDEFATTLTGKFVSKDLAELKTKVKEHLIKNSDDKYLNDVLNAIVKEIKKGSTFEIHDRLIEENIERRIHNIEYQAKSYGLSLDEFLKIQNLDLEKAKADFKEQIINEFQNSLITEAIVENEKIAMPTKDELSEYLGTSVDDYLKNFNSYFTQQGNSKEEADLHAQNYLNNTLSTMIQRKVNDKLLVLNGFKKEEKKVEKEKQEDKPKSKKEENKEEKKEKKEKKENTKKADSK